MKQRYGADTREHLSREIRLLLNISLRKRARVDLEMRPSRQCLGAATCKAHLNMKHGDLGALLNASLRKCLRPKQNCLVENATNRLDDNQPKTNPVPTHGVYFSEA